MPYPYKCGDCNYLNLNDRKGFDYYCTKNHYYISKNSNSCSRLSKYDHGDERCGDCKHFDKNNTRYGKSYCDATHGYVPNSMTKCRKFEKGKYTSSGCYLTTCMCDILGEDDNCEALDTLRGFRDNYMMQDDRYYDILDDYDFVGPYVCEKMLDEDEYKQKFIAKTMLGYYIKPAIVCISKEDYDGAIDIYKDMTINLAEHYGFDINQLNCFKDKEYARKREFAYKVNPV